MRRGPAILFGKTASLTRCVTCGCCVTLLLDSRDWSKAADAFAHAHDDFFFRLRRVERLCAKLDFTPGPDGEAQRQRTEALFAANPEFLPDMAASGPEARCDAMIFEWALLN